MSGCALCLQHTVDTTLVVIGAEVTAPVYEPLEKVSDEGLAQAKLVSFGTDPTGELPVVVHMFAVVSALVVRRLRGRQLRGQLPSPSDLDSYVHSGADCSATTLAGIGQLVCANLAAESSSPLVTSDDSQIAASWLRRIKDPSADGTPWGAVVVLRLRGRVVGVLLPDRAGGECLLVCPFIDGLFDGERGLSASIHASLADLHPYLHRLLPAVRTEKVEGVIVTLRRPTSIAGAAREAEPKRVGVVGGAPAAAAAGVSAGAPFAIVCCTDQTLYSGNGTLVHAHYATCAAALLCRGPVKPTDLNACLAYARARATDQPPTHPLAPLQQVMVDLQVGTPERYLSFDMLVSQLSTPGWIVSRVCSALPLGDVVVASARPRSTKVLLIVSAHGRTFAFVLRQVPQDADVCGCAGFYADTLAMPNEKKAAFACNLTFVALEPFIRNALSTGSSEDDATAPCSVVAMRAAVADALQSALLDSAVACALAKQSGSDPEQPVRPAGE